MLDHASGVVMGQASAPGGKDAGGGSPEEVARARLAAQLSAMMGMDLPLCVRALERNRDDPDRAAEWLLGPQAEVSASCACELRGVVWVLSQHSCMPRFACYCLFLSFGLGRGGAAS